MVDRLRSSEQWPAVARTIADATGRGVVAAQSADDDEFTDAVSILVDHAQAAREVHALMLRELLETAFQDGIDGDDVAGILDRTVDDARRRGTPTEPTAVVEVLTGALGLNRDSDTDDGGTPDISSADIVVATIAVTSLLVAETGVDLGPYLTRAVDEVRRSQTVEMP